MACAEETISDLTLLNRVVLHRIESEFTDDDREDLIPRLNAFADRLGEITAATRGLLAVIAARLTEIGAPEAARRIGRDRQTVYALVDELDAAGIAWLDDTPFEGELPKRIVVRPVARDWPEFWEALRDHMANREDATVEDVIGGLDFSLLG